jgi:hypothetical protein
MVAQENGKIKGGVLADDVSCNNFGALCVVMSLIYFVYRWD